MVQGRFADKVVKVPSKRRPEGLRFNLESFDANGGDLSFRDLLRGKGQCISMNFLRHYLP